ncbi:MAG: nucleotidyltransferase domain-containing protein [Erythrobacter sp.]
MIQLALMKLETVTTLCRLFEEAGLSFWVDGGWGVDALLQRQTRDHSDLDLAVPLAELSQFERSLLPLGYRRSDRPEDPSWNWVLRHDTEGSVDLHGFVLNAHADGVLGEPSENSMYPAGSLDGFGKLGELPVRCIAAPFVLAFRNSFEPRVVDHHDVAALCDRFGLARPTRFLSTDATGS